MRWTSHLDRLVHNKWSPSITEWYPRETKNEKKDHSADRENGVSLSWRRWRRTGGDQQKTDQPGKPVLDGHRTEYPSDLVLNSQTRNKRERAFDLAHIESELEEEERRKNLWEHSRINDFAEFSDRICRDKCNEDLRRGLDMVKAHMAFGSIGVPPVIDETDLKLFCRLDSQHNHCLRDCGFAVQMNTYDFICKHQYLQMTYLLPCYRHAAPRLKNECGEQRCGPYNSFDNTIIGYAHRCRLLICDIKCMTDVLFRQCGNGYGQQAANFLIKYSRQQVSSWMQFLTYDSNNRTRQSPRLTAPRSCSRFFCQKLDLIQCFL